MTSERSSRRSEVQLARAAALGRPTPASVAALLDRMMADDRTDTDLPGWLLEPDLLAKETNILPGLESKSFTARQLAILTGRDKLPKHLHKRAVEAFTMALRLAYRTDARLRAAGVDPESL